MSFAQPAAVCALGDRPQAFAVPTLPGRATAWVHHQASHHQGGGGQGMDGERSPSHLAGTTPRRNTGACGNRLLDAIPANRFALLEPHLERVTLAPGRTLLEPGDDVTHAYFPCGG